MEKKLQETIRIAKKTFKEIQSEFPDIKMTIDENDKNVELNMDIPEQNGINYKVNLNLQNLDELHFCVSSFWCEWFPCTNPKITEDFKNAVIGYLKGNHRVLEYHNSYEAYKAKLQSFKNNKWKTIATWSTLHWPIVIKKTKKIINNKMSA